MKRLVNKVLRNRPSAQESEVKEIWIHKDCPEPRHRLGRHFLYLSSHMTRFVAISGPFLTAVNQVATPLRSPIKQAQPD